MKAFQIKASLASGLAHRLDKLDAQVVADACGIDVIKGIRTNQGIVNKINLANKTFMEAVMATEAKKRIVFDEMQAKYRESSKDLPTEEAARVGRELTAEFNKQAAEIQKESQANPDEIITVTMSDEDYEKVLLPVFKKTAQLWDVNGDGGGQKLFIEVADAIEAVL